MGEDLYDGGVEKEDPHPPRAQPPPTAYPPNTKSFVPLENNPATLSLLARSLGVSPALTFHDIYSLTDASLLATLTPRPAYALIFICPAEIYFAARAAESHAVRHAPPYSGTGSNSNSNSNSNEPAPVVMWFRQTIRHACGLIALLHALANGPAKKFITRNSPLERLLKEAAPLGPAARAELLYNSKALEDAHAEAAGKGDTRAPAAEEECEFHYITFVKVDGDVDEGGRLWELEGAWKAGPLDRGVLGPEEDVLSERALEAGVGRFLRVAAERESGDGGGEMRFSLVAVTSGG